MSASWRGDCQLVMYASSSEKPSWIGGDRYADKSRRRSGALPDTGWAVGEGRTSARGLAGFDPHDERVDAEDESRAVAGSY